jgi:hypothetical protein
MLPTGGQISAAQVAYFALAVPPLLYVLFKHGKHGLFGWFFLVAFCMLRVVGDGMVLQAESHGTFSADGALISQIGLSPLCFAITGIAHEASKTVAHRSKFILGWPLHVITHVLVVTGLPLVVVGATNASTPGQTPDQINKAVAMVRAGAAVFIIIFILISIQVFVSFRQSRTIATEKWLLLAAVAAMPEFLLRVLYLVLGAMINSESWSFLSGGTLAEQIVLEVVPEFLMVLLFVSGGIATRNLPQDRAAAQRNGHHEMVNERIPGMP